MKAVFHIVPHTHWDREWFAPGSYTREWLVPFFESLFARFEVDDEYRFVLDGQTILIEDYLAQLSDGAARAALARIGELVRSGRLAVGPYYQQPDWQLASGEALVHNLLIGVADARALGGINRAGWLLDNFGQIAQTVQLHAGFDLEGIFSWRGFDLLPDRVRTELWWEGPDGSRLPLIYLIDSYRNGMRLFSFPQFAERRKAAIESRLLPFSGDANILLMNGYDQEMEPERPEGLRPSLPADYLAAKSRALSETSLTVTGSQYSGRFISVFPGILSARNYLKLANDRAQTTQERYIDPLAALLMYGLRGAGVPIAGDRVAGAAAAGPDLASLRAELDVLWRLILQNHPHDTICGVSADPVIEEAELRFEEIHRRQSEFFAAAVRALGLEETAAGAPGEKLAVFNPSLHARRVMIDGVWRERLAPLAVDLVSGDAPREAGPDGMEGAAGEPTVTVEDGAAVLRNEAVELRVSIDGTFEVGAAPGAGAAPRRITFRDVGDAGDTYSYDRPAADAPRDVHLSRGELAVTQKTTDAVQVRLRGILELPEALAADRSRRSTSPVENPVSVYVELRRGEGFVRIALSLENRSRDHRLQVVFQGGAQLATLGQFYWDHPEEQLAHLRRFPEEELSTSVTALMLGAREPELPRFVPSERAFAVGGAEDEGALLVAHRGMHELEPLEGGGVAATVLRAVGWLARPDLASRTGDAGPHIFTPDAQCAGRSIVGFMVAPLPGVASAGAPHAARMIEEYLNPPLVLGRAGPRTAAEVQEPLLAPQAGWVPADVADQGAMVSTLKVREEGDGVVLRLYNPTRRPLTLIWPGAVQRARLDERREAGAGGDTHRLEPAQIATVLLAAGPEPVAGGPDDPRGAERRFAAALTGRLPSIRLGARRRALRPEFWAHLLGCARVAVEHAEAEHAEGPASDSIDAYVQAGIEAERARVSRIEAELPDARASYEAALAEDPGLTRSETLQARSRVSTLERQLLEARLSLLYARRHAGTVDEKLFARELRATALELNHARVAKRTDDYLLATGTSGEKHR